MYKYFFNQDTCTLDFSQQYNFSLHFLNAYMNIIRCYESGANYWGPDEARPSSIIFESVFFTLSDFVLHSVSELKIFYTFNKMKPGQLYHHHISMRFLWGWRCVGDDAVTSCKQGVSGDNRQDSTHLLYKEHFKMFLSNFWAV